MRTINAFRNTIVSLLLQLLLLVFGLIMPRLIILTYGSAVNGLTSTINQVISLLTLLQAGAVGASIFEMYKPIVDKDYLKISLILETSKRYFTKLGAIFIGIVIVIAPFIAFNKATDGLDAWEILLSVIILGLNGAYSFFFIASYDIVFSSHQKRYIMSLAEIIEKIIYYGILFCILNNNFHFIFMYLAVIFGNTVKVIFLSITYRNSYAKQMIPIGNGNKYRIRNRGYLLWNQISIQVVESSPIILLSTLYGLNIVSVYSVYNLVQTTIKTLFNTLQYSVSAVFGNLVAAESDDDVNRVFNILQFIFFLFGAWMYSCTAFLLMSFVKLYTSNITDVNYIYPTLVVLIVGCMISYCLFIPYHMIINVYGLYKETYKQMIICGVISIIVSIWFGLVDMPYVLVGLIFYYLSSFIYRIIIIKRYKPWFIFNKLLQRTAVLVSLPMLSYMLHSFTNIAISSWLEWILLAFITVIIITLIIYIYICAFERQEFAMCLQYGKQIFHRKNDIYNKGDANV